MKILHLSIIIIFSASLGIANNLVFADSANNVEILNIQTHPSTIKVGDAFTITATLVNNSPVPIFVEFSDCEGPFTTTFDNHVTIHHGNLTCAYSLFRQMLNSNEKTTKTSPGTILVYKATTPGTANATVTFHYYVKNQTDPNALNIKKTISKSFLFTISDAKTDVIVSNYRSNTPVIVPLLKSPLEQFKSGLDPYFITCKQNLDLVIKINDNSPACVKSTSLERLLRQGWVNAYDNNGKYLPIETQTIKVQDSDFLLHYSITGGNVKESKLDSQSLGLIISLNTTNNGTLTVTIPRTLLDTTNDPGSQFIMLADGQQIEFKQIRITISDRTFSIPFQNGTSKLMILGTHY